MSDSNTRDLAEPVGYTVVATAQLVSTLRWVSDHLAQLLADWSVEAADTAEPESAVWLAVVSRCLHGHASGLASHQPDSVLMEPYREPRPASAGHGDVLHDIAGTEGNSNRLAVTQGVLIPQLVSVCEAVRAHAAPHCDAPLAAAVDHLARDLRRLAKPAGINVNPSQASNATRRVAKNLDDTGGLVPAHLLSPGW